MLRGFIAHYFPVLQFIRSFVVFPVSLGFVSAVGLVFAGAHELNTIYGNVLLLYGLLNAALVRLEALGARVSALVAFQELLGEPTVKALVVLPLQVGARLPHAVHLR